MSKLFVIPARDVPVAVVLRRGPSAWAHVMLWDLTTDRFAHGAWLHGRIYEERCDVSPDGRLLLTFVHKASGARTAYTHAWTALSRPPWLHALTLWPQGTTYGGGGRFATSRSAVLRSSAPRSHPDHALAVVDVTPGGPALRASEGIVDGADWSGRGQDGRVVFATGGKLFRRVRNADVEVADFTTLEPAPVEAPAWAREAPGSRRREPDPFAD